MRTTTSAVQIEGLGLTRRNPAGNAVEILSDINLDFAERSFVSIVGPSGCGKTTLLRICAGLLEPTQGRAVVSGEVASAGNHKKAVVFQNDSLLPWRRVQDNIALGLERTRVPRSERHRVADELAALVGLAGYERHFPHELSGGMRQRANVARALAVDPDVLLMDEPFSALDAQTREVMQSELLRIWQAGRKTVMFVTHQIDEAVYLSDRVIVLSSRPGEVVADLDIDLPRPRAVGVKLTTEFTDYVRHIWSLIDPQATLTLKEADPS